MPIHPTTQKNQAMTTQQPEPLHIANELEDEFGFFGEAKRTVETIRRLHAESELHQQELASYRFTVENRDARILELEARVQELEAVQERLAKDSKRLDWLDRKNQGHPYYTGYVWQKEGYEDNRGLVAAIQTKKEMMSARQAIDAAMLAAAPQPPEAHNSHNTRNNK